MPKGSYRNKLALCDKMLKIKEGSGKVEDF